MNNLEWNEINEEELTGEVIKDSSIYYESQVLELYFKSGNVFRLEQAYPHSDIEISTYTLNNEYSDNIEEQLKGKMIKGIGLEPWIYWGKDWDSYQGYTVKLIFEDESILEVEFSAHCDSIRKPKLFIGKRTCK